MSARFFSMSTRASSSLSHWSSCSADELHELLVELVLLFLEVLEIHAHVPCVLLTFH